MAESLGGCNFSSMTTATRKTQRKPVRSRNRQTRARRSSMQLRRILVPIDFSLTSRRALDFAVPLADQFKARITLLHVIEPVMYPQEIGPVAVSEVHLVQGALKELTNLARELVPAARLHRVLTRTGLPYREIADAAKDLDIDLIVATTHGHTGLKRVLLGSTAERIVRHAPCPVLTVRQ